MGSGGDDARRALTDPKLGGNPRAGRGLCVDRLRRVPMNDALALKRRLAPEEPGVGPLLFFSLIAAAGFAVGWMTQMLGSF